MRRGGGGFRDVGRSGRRKNRKRADGGSVNDVNGKNGKGENQSGEKEEMGAAGLEIVRQKKGMPGGWVRWRGGGSRVWREKERAIRVR